VIRRPQILLTADENMLYIHARILYNVILYMYRHTHVSLLCSDLNFVCTVRMPNYRESWIRQQDAGSDTFRSSKTWYNAGIRSLSI